MWRSRHTHKAWLPLRSSLSALRPHPQLPLWSVMGLLRSASSILITGQNPLNGIWFAIKGRGRAVSHWTRLSLGTSIAPHPHPFHSPFQAEAGMLIRTCISPTIGWVCVYWCVCVCVCVCVPGSGRWRGRSAVPWEMLFVAYRSTSRSMLSGLDRLRGWRHNSLGCRDLWKRMPSHAAAVFQPTSASRRLIFSAGVERTEEKFDEVLTSTYFLLCLACRFTNSFSLALVCLTGLPTISVIICISYFLIDRIESN